MAGLTPFLFTSARELKETGKWYEMYINPESLNTENAMMNTRVNTKAAIAHLHWRQDLPKISVGGASGWIGKESILQNVTNDIRREVSELVGLGPKTQKTTKDYIKQYGNQLKNNVLSLKRTNLTLNPREFIKTLQEIALEDMYYIDSNGVEHTNRKKILIYTKRHPNGLILEGFFNSFAIPETAQDPQVIKYSFAFTVERVDDSQQSVSFLKNAIRELITTTNLTSKL